MKLGSQKAKPQPCTECGVPVKPYIGWEKGKELLCNDCTLEESDGLPRPHKKLEELR